jgi:deoxycytidylate deaminase
MELLEGSGLEKAIKYTYIAAKIAETSPCKREKRGVIIVKSSIIIGTGVNSPPCPFQCEPDYCGESCRVPAVHAEMNAILNVENRHYLEGAVLYHAKIDEEGVLQNSRKPRCADCSKHILQAGIAGVVLKHEEGYVFYDSREFHLISLGNFRKRNLI